jgi:hypothetical protein
MAGRGGGSSTGRVAGSKVDHQLSSSLERMIQSSCLRRYSGFIRQPPSKRINSQKSKENANGRTRPSRPPIGQRRGTSRPKLVSLNPSDEDLVKKIPAAIDATLPPAASVGLFNKLMSKCRALSYTFSSGILASFIVRRVLPAVQYSSVFLFRTSPIPERIAPSARQKNNSSQRPLQKTTT